MAEDTATLGRVLADRVVEVWAEPHQAGAGIAIGSRGVLTARHVIADALPSGRILVRIVPTGRLPTSVPEFIPVAQVWDDAVWDLAVLRVDDARWPEPGPPSPAVVWLDARPEPECHAVGFAQADVQTDPHGVTFRQTTAVLGRLLPAGQARPPVDPARPLPRRWLPLDVQNDPPELQAGWGGMSGAGVLLPDGQLAAVVTDAGISAGNRTLFVVPLADALADSHALVTALAQVSGTGPVVVQIRDAARNRADLMPDTLARTGAPKAVSEQELDAFGVKPAARLTGEDSSFFSYVTRDDDTTLRLAVQHAAQVAGLGQARMLLIVGASASGKSRSAAEAVRCIEALATRLLLRPKGGAHLEALADWPAQELAQAVVWLDDVAQYAHPGFAATVGGLLEAGAVVVATIRRNELDALTPSGDLQNPFAQALTDEELVQQIPWRRSWSTQEQDRAQTV
ncbi:S1 family peptidase, partial [Nocardia sp. AB354]|uniref:S1 family peptidase n=1 Tax=Nocardia sp. AB354 TaxID=3413283 RepID=UPI003C13D776